MPIDERLEIIHIIWDGPKTVTEAATTSTEDEYGVYQIYGMHDVTGPDTLLYPNTLLYIGQADVGTFAGRIIDHQQEWGRWNPDEIRVYLGRLAGLGSITNSSGVH
jgi:hypothetical protein